MTMRHRWQCGIQLELIDTYDAIKKQSESEHDKLFVILFDIL